MVIALYGGSFNPPHLGHIDAARVSLEKLNADKLILMPASVPPHKALAQHSPASSERLEMTKLAAKLIPGAEVSDYEIQKEGRSYTVETLRCLKKEHPEDRLFMLIGEDMFLSLDTWRAPDEIMALATIVALRRKDGDLSVMEAKAEEYKSRYGAKIILIEDEPLEVSSTQIRNMIAEGKDTGDLLPESVLEYIKEHNLYKNEN